MGKGTIDWDGVEAWQRLVASIIASGVKLDLRAIATFYGTTYDSLENRLRKVKKDATTLKEEIDSGQRGEVVPTRTKSAPSTPRKPKTPKKTNGALDTVTNGRVAKTSPSKKSKIKQEALDNSVAASFSETSDDPNSTIDHTPMGYEFDFEQSFGGGNSMIGMESTD